MTSTGVREQRVVETFLALTDTLVTDYDVLDLMTMLTERAVELLGVTAAGVLLADAYTDGPDRARGSHNLQRALEHRVLIEQATGVLVAQGGLLPHDAHGVLRSYASSRELRLPGVCRDVIDRRVDLTTFIRPAR